MGSLMKLISNEFHKIPYCSHLCYQKKITSKSLQEAHLATFNTCTIDIMERIKGELSQDEH